MAKVVHFGDRLREIIAEKYLTQIEFAKRVGRSDNRVSAWCGMREFANQAPVKRALSALWADGVDPRYLWDETVTAWKVKAITDPDELEVHDMRITIAEQRREIDSLKRELRQMAKVVKELKGK